jgi:signal peptidase I
MVCVRQYAVVPDKQSTAPGEPRGSRRRLLVGTGVLAAVAIVAVVASFLGFRRYQPPTEAMSPTIKPGDWIWTRPTTGSDVGRGDIVLLITPKPVGILARQDKVVERVLAVGGDTLEAHGGTLFVNGRQVIEPYVRAGMETADIPATRVPARTVYVLGDNRENSQGSRVYGPVPFANVKERVVKRRAPSPALVVAVGVLLCLPFLVVAATTTLRTRRDGSSQRAR